MVKLVGLKDHPAQWFLKTVFLQNRVGTVSGLLIVYFP